jgi:polyribonucleotide nucleotidyltransferase
VRKLVGGKRIDSVDDVLKIGQKIQVELKEIDPRGKLSLGAVLAEDAAPADAAPVGDAAPADVATEPSDA